jgi:hypothetical protein
VLVLKTRAEKGVSGFCTDMGLNNPPPIWCATESTLNKILNFKRTIKIFKGGGVRYRILY